MAMTEDNGFPRLTPPDDRLPSREHLLRSGEELSDEQFDLLAAAWAEDALEGESLDEMNQLLASFPSRMARAESFRNIRLIPFDDRWSGTGRLLRRSAALAALRRSIVPTLAAAAALIAFILSGPGTLRHTTDRLPTQPTEVAVINEVLIPSATPIIVERSHPEIAVRPSLMGEAEDVTRQLVFSITEPARTTPINTDYRAVSPDLIANQPAGELAVMRLNTFTTTTLRDNEPNWMLKGISLLARAVIKDEKKIDGYTIANRCVNGINSVLGWDMELEQMTNRKGDPDRVIFNSSLISFSAPLNKATPRL